MSNSTDILDYDALVQEFEDGLVNNLRRHGVGDDFLEMWVPDPDPVKGVLNMAEAAESFGLEQISMQVSQTTIPSARHDELLKALGVIGTTSITTDPGQFVVTVRIGE
ncbi:hypothetical protein GH722_12740 [Alphaproteobacteria bacterium HT1-32]|nr:hypothetical protein [Alphaproteobacteria bacterium HT1-32]|tara:strand:- start:47082 stop:47405 length:324 start_codon:yes stop_codon:yes gene_type:complete